MTSEDYSKRKILKYFTKGTSGITCLVEGNIVKKVYTNDVERRMGKEARALERLEKYGHFPKIIHKGQNTLYMTYVGRSIKYYPKLLLPKNFGQQINEIIFALKVEDVFHQDLIIDHITLHKGRIYIIDFEKSMTNEELLYAKQNNLPRWRVLKYHDVNYLRTYVKKILSEDYRKINTPKGSWSLIDN